MYTIYALIDPRDNAVRYIGITERLVHQRLQEHLTNVDGNLKKSAWISELRQLGMSPVVRSLEQVEDRAEALKCESHWIQHYHKLETPLTNIQGNPSVTRSHRLLDRISTKNTEEWVTISLAAQRLGVSATRISALALNGKLRTRRDLVDLRLKLVEYNEVYNLFSSGIRYKND